MLVFLFFLLPNDSLAGMVSCLKVDKNNAIALKRDINSIISRRRCRLNPFKYTLACSSEYFRINFDIYSLLFPSLCVENS